MEKIIMDRGMGKTTKLIKLSAERMEPILCFSLKEEERIKKQARSMGMSIPAPISVTRGHLPGTRFPKEGFLIDEADAVLDALIYQHFGSHVSVLTISAKKEPSWVEKVCMKIKKWMET